MPNNERTWQEIIEGAIRGQYADKRVRYSDFARIRGMDIGQEGKGYTTIFYRSSGMWLGLSVVEDTIYQTLKIPGAGHIEIPGAPELPQEGLFIAIPENADIRDARDVSADTSGIHYLTTDNIVRPVPSPVTGMEEPRYRPDPSIYGGEAPYPLTIVEFLGTKRVAGRKVAHIMIYPVQFNPRAPKRLKVFKTISLKVTYHKAAGNDAVATRRILQNTPSDSLILDTIDQLTEERRRLESEPDSGSGDPTHAPTRDAPKLGVPNNWGQFLIITTDKLMCSVKDLAEARANTPDVTSVKVVTKKQILDEFGAEGLPEYEAIRNFLICARGWMEPPMWVVLAGDIADIPTCFQKSESAAGEPLAREWASDHFYADLDDANGLIPEMVVARLATSDFDQMKGICERVATSRKPASQREQQILFLTDNKDKKFATCTEQLVKQIGNRYKCMKQDVYLDNINNIIAKINEGCVGLINYRGHGLKKGWKDPIVFQKDHVELLNGETLPVVLSIACLNNAINYDKTSFGEFWICNGKAAAFLGGSTWSNHPANDDFNECLFEAILGNPNLERPLLPQTRIGEIVKQAKTRLCEQSTGSPQVRNNVRMYILLGDPFAEFGGT